MPRATPYQGRTTRRGPIPALTSEPCASLAVLGVLLLVRFPYLDIVQTLHHMLSAASSSRAYETGGSSG